MGTPKVVGMVQQGKETASAGAKKPAITTMSSKFPGATGGSSKK